MGVALLVAIVFLLANVILYMTFFTAEETVSSTNVLGAGQFNLNIESDDGGSWDQYEINDRYAFGLAIDPNGDAVAGDANGDNDENVPPISLSNK